MKIAAFRPRRSGFTLIELLVVIAILVALAAAVFVVASRSVQQARIASSMNKMRDLGTVFGVYAADYGHYPPGWDSSYGLGPMNRNGAPMNGRGPDLVNAYQDLWEMNERWLSPVVQGRLVGYEGNNQPSNYSGHPRLSYNGGDHSDPFPATGVQRPSEVFLLCDGIPKNPADVNDPGSSKNAQTGIRQWNRYWEVSDPRRGQSPLPTSRSDGRDSNGPDFRNNGKCHVMFCDGAVRGFRPEDFKVKHVSLRF